jgi:hypothetical protein
MAITGNTSNFNLNPRTAITGFYEFDITVTTSGQGGTSYTNKITRRFNDILWLHENLLKDHPGCKLPLPPEKNFWLKFIVGNKSKIEERANSIESYLNELSSHSVLRKDYSFKKFSFDEVIDHSINSKQFFGKLNVLSKFQSQAPYIPGMHNIEDNAMLEKERYLMVKLYHCLAKVKGLIENFVKQF